MLLPNRGYTPAYFAWQHFSSANAVSTHLSPLQTMSGLWPVPTIRARQSYSSKKYHSFNCGQRVSEGEKSTSKAKSMDLIC
jgi:hypothetical protein